MCEVYVRRCAVTEVGGKEANTSVFVARRCAVTEVGGKEANTSVFAVLVCSAGGVQLPK